MKIIKVKVDDELYEIEGPKTAKNFYIVETFDGELRVYFKVKASNKKYLDAYTVLNKKTDKTTGVD